MIGHNGRYSSLAALLGLFTVLSVCGADTNAQTSATDQNSSGVPDLFPLTEHRRTNIQIVEQLKRNHYEKKKLDDQLSSDIYDNYLSSLDRNKTYFTQNDITSFEKYRFELDDSLNKGDLKIAFEIFNVYQKRLTSFLKFSVDLVKSRQEKLDFTKDEYLDIDRESASWPETQETQRALWKRRVKAQILSMRLNDKPAEEITETLEKRYSNQLKMVARTKSEDAFQLYMNSFTSIFDPHTTYFSPRTSDNFNINMSLSLEGIGAVLKSEDDMTSIVRLVPAGPAAKSGELSPADKITAVGQGSTGPMIDIVGWRLDDVVSLIRGPKGSTVKLQVLSKEGDQESTKNVSIVRNTIKLEEQAAQGRILEVELTDAGVPTTTELVSRAIKLGVIEIPTFYIDFKAQQKGEKDYRSTTRDVKRIIAKMKQEGVDGLLIDLRSNGGGSLQEADQMTGLFLGSVPTVQVKAARRDANIFANNGQQVAWEGPLAVLVNRLSASASEIFAGAIQDYGRGIVLGSQTFGKGTVQTLIPLNRGQLKLTAAKFYRVSGKSTQHRGIIPDIEFPTLVDFEEIGESSLDGALVWDVIEPIDYKKEYAVGNRLENLELNHQKRVQSNPYFTYYKAISEKAEENKLKKTISLKESTRLAEKQNEDKWRLMVENNLRVSTGKTAATSLDHLEELEEAEEPTDADENSTNETQQSMLTFEKIKDDPMLEEAGRVLRDLIKLNSASERGREIASVGRAP